MKGIKLGFLATLCVLPPLVAGAVSRLAPGESPSAGAANSNIQDLRQEASTQSKKTRAVANTDDKNSSRAATSRVVSRPNASVQATNSTSVTPSRALSLVRSQAISETNHDNLNTISRNSGRNTRTEAASINNNPAVRRAGLSLRPSTAEVGGRAIMASGEQTGSNIESEIRNLQSRTATIRSREQTGLADAATIAAAQQTLEQTAALNKSCQEQYNECMDQFCAVIDSNQKRCSCSSNLAKYTNVEKAVKEANTQLNEVAQNIRYVGLSADEISAIMSATEAEEALSGTVDTTESRSMLEQIEKMIKDPTVATSSSSLTADSYGLLDIDLDFNSSDLDDLFNLDLFNNSGSGFSNLRGTDLYNAAKKRCNTIITQCKEVGATSQQITGNYDLAIDKDCIAYEQGLTKMNETLVSNVRSATRMLQKARLAVMQNQNAYDARECIGALEKCMTDDMVCGEDYFKCLDPTKRYIDENGGVVLGQNINYIQNFMTEFSNADITSSFLSSAYTTSIETDGCAREPNNDGRCVVKYLLTKIGTQQSPTAEGLCRPVLDKCRAYTYDTRGNYNRFNDIVINYIQRAMVNIRAAQYQIVSDYASSCLNDIATCYNQQVSQVNSWSSTAAVSSVYNIMRGACRNVALTCGYAVFAADTESCSDENTCIESISEIFYQSLLCPDNSIYVEGNHEIDANNTTGGFVNAKCQCQSNDFVVFNGACLPKCDYGAVYLNTGVCGTACPAHSSETDVSSAEFYGHCKCDSANNYHWFETKTACKKCPANSTYSQSPTSDGLEYYEKKCTCNTSGNDQYFSICSGKQCAKCPNGTAYNSDWTHGDNGESNRCIGNDNDKHYCHDKNAYVVATIPCSIVPIACSVDNDFTPSNLINFDL